MTTPRNAKITFISAGAGSGKTHRLTELLQEELTLRGARPAGVIATTFTRKAAAELRERVRAQLLQQGRFALANAMGQARIGTVNSVCGQLVARFAFEAGLSVEQQVLEEAQAALVLDRAIDAVLDGPQMDTLLALVERLGLKNGRNGDKEEWKEALQTLVNQIRSNDIPLDQLDGFAKANADALLAHFPTPTHEDLDAAVLQAIRVAMPQIEAVAAAGNKKNTATYLALVKDFKRDLEHKSAPWSAWIKLSKAAPEASLRATIEAISALAGRAAEHAGLHADVRRYLALMFALAGRALAHYQTVKQEMGTLDFADQEHQLLGLLDHPEVSAVLEDELDLLMVDEFQDTSPIQLALFLKLARFAKRVYWVGDVKQAIYGFRGSDTALMQSILAALPTLGGQKEVLPASWRSRPELVKLVNAVFAHAFADTLRPEEVALKPTREDDLPGAVVANWLLGGKNIDEEGSALAAGLRRLVDSGHLVLDKAQKRMRPVRYGHIALLAASHERVKTWVAALSAQGIPVATAQPGLLATPEATLALACLRRFNDAGDTIASAEIVSLTDGADPEQWVADRLRYLATGAAQELWREVAIDGHPAHPVLETLRHLRAARPVLAPREALATVMAACALPAIVLRWRTRHGASADGARVRLANLEALLALAEQYEALCRSAQHAASVSGLILWLDEIAGQGQDMLAEPAIDAVKVMTHHAAKGLEWPVVVLTDLAKDIKDRLWSISAHTAAPFDANQPLGARFIRYWPWPFGPQQKLAVADEIALTDTAAAFRAAAIDEEKRLLYVSMTRARDLLVLARSSRKPSGPWLDALEAPWLLPDHDEEQGDLGVLRLPTGESVRAERWMLEPTGAHPANPVDEDAALHGFPSVTRASVTLPLHFNPSKAQDGRPVSVVDRCRIGERIAVASGVDMSALGMAIHACLALSFTDPRVPLTEGEVCQLLEGFGVTEHVPAADVLRQVTALHGWIQRRWPGVRAHAEFPVQSVMPNGQLLNGRIDLLLETATGWVLIDHKSSPLPVERWETLAAEHGPQLSSYAQALERVTGRAVQEAWLFLPVAGGGLALGFG
ncbi:MAG: UvrD-helicase domain-containing protein [Burkholderiaceae bacterium]|nr:UvrD-helicase domain-containing protein [Burkholderiaceae bacterium]